MSINTHLVCGVCRRSKTPRGCVTPGRDVFEAAHSYKFKQKRARTDYLKYSMVYRTIPTWDSLPAAVAEADSLDIFKSRLSALRS